MSQYLIQQIRDKANIRVEPYTEVISVRGEDHLEQITTVTRPPNSPECTQTYDAKALFIMIGVIAKTDWLPREIERDEEGYMCTGRDLTTWTFERGRSKPAGEALRFWFQKPVFADSILS